MWYLPTWYKQLFSFPAVLITFIFFLLVQSCIALRLIGFFQRPPLAIYSHEEQKKLFERCAEIAGIHFSGGSRLFCKTTLKQFVLFSRLWSACGGRFAYLLVNKHELDEVTVRLQCGKAGIPYFYSYPRSFDGWSFERVLS